MRKPTSKPLPQAKRSGPGRPQLSSDGSEQVSVRFPAHILKAVAGIIDEGGNVSDRATVIRQLVAEALKARKLL